MDDDANEFQPAMIFLEFQEEGGVPFITIQTDISMSKEEIIDYLDYAATSLQMELERGPNLTRVK